MAEEKKINTSPEKKNQPQANGSALKKKKSGFFRIVFISFLSLMLFIILLVSATQTSVFRNILKDYIVDTFNDKFSSKMTVLSVGEIEGNFFSEVIIKNASLKVKNNEMVKFDFVKVNYSIFGLLDKHVNVSELTLENPTANFFRIVNDKGDSVWNIVYAFETAKDSVDEAAEFNWKIDVQKLRINNLNYVMYGALPYDAAVLSNLKPEKSITSENLKIGTLNFEAKAEYDKNAIKLWIHHLGFHTNFGFDLKGLSGEFYLSSSRAEINHLNIETARSWIQSDYIFIDKINLINFEELKGLETFKGKEKQLRMSFKAKNFNFDDLKAFLPQVDFLDNEVSLELKCKGIFDDIAVESMKLRTANSNFEFAGRMVNLTEPQKLWFDMKGNNLRIDPRDTKIYTPGLPIPDYSHVGTVTGDVTYKGEPVNFETTFDVQSSVGNAKGFFNLDLTTKNFDYSTSVDASGMNVGKLLKDPKLESSITGKIEAKGSGFDLAVINADVKYELRDTKIYEQKIDKSAGTIGIRGYNIEADVTYASGKFDAAIKGNANIRDFNNPIYNLKGHVKNFDVSMFTKNQRDKSSLSFTFDLNGKGISPENLEGDYKINLANSYYGEYDFLATPIDLKISTSGTNDFVTLSSNLIDFNAKGNFKLVEIGDVIASNVTMIQNEISKKFNLDTILPVQPVKVFSSDMNFTYELKTKNTEAITKMFFLNDLYFSGDVKGYIRNSANGFEGRSDVRLSKFSYMDTVFNVSNFNAELIHFNNYPNYKFAPKGDFGAFNSTINIHADKMRSGANTFDSVKANFILSNANQSVRFFAKQDTTLKAELFGNINLAEDTVTLKISDLNINYNNLDIGNKIPQGNENEIKSDPIIVSYDPASSERTLSFNKFTIFSRIVNVDLSGKISLSGESDFTAELSNIDIPSVMQYAYDPKSVYAQKESQKFKTPLKGKIRRVSMYMKGTMENPLLSLEMNTGVIRYDQIRVGRVDAFIDYAAQNLATDILVSNAQGQGSLRLTGNIPFNNPIVTPDSSSYMAMLTKPLDLSLKARNFQINFFSKLIPNFSDIRGFLDGQINATGTIAEPLLTGDAKISKGRMFFNWTGSYYRFESSLKTENSDLIVENFSLYNDRDRSRHIDVFGKINFSGLSLNYIDLTTRGDVVLLDETSIQNRFGFYGDMVAGIGDPPITIKGNLTNLLVSGQLKIKSAKLYFPSISSLEYDIYSDDFTYKIITDPAGNQYLDTVITVSEEELPTLDPFLRYNYILEKREPTVADYITYDLDIDLEKNIYVNMNMNSLTREELNGEFQGDLKLDNRTPDKRFQLFGRLNIVGDSYYRFYKNFKINNSYIDFIGDYNNPLLNIQAVYRNVRTVTSPSGSSEQEIMYVILKIDGTRYKPALTLSLRKDDLSGQLTEGPQAQSDALGYLIFGMPLNDVTGVRSRDILGNLANNVGSGVASSLLYEAMRNIPGILNAEVNYTGGDITGTDIRITSAVGDAIVRFGGKILTSINNFEVSVEYPLNKLFNIDVSNNLMLEIARARASTFVINNDQGFETRASITYKIRY